MAAAWHKPEVNRDSVWRGYVDQFEQGHAAGLLQETGQNSFDAYPDAAKPKDMKVVVKYDADKRTLTWRDFDTRGMGHCDECKWGERPDGKPCVNNKCAWGAFHNMGYSVKDGTFSLGSRGMGKSLVLLSGKQTIVRTTLPDGRAMASQWEKQEDWVWRNAPELSHKLSAPGTEIETTGVVKAVHEDLDDFDWAVRELQQRWFRLLDEGTKLTYVLVKGGKTHHREISTPSWPALDATHGAEKARLELPKVVVKYQDQVLGELHNLELFIAKSPFNEDDPRYGIAIVKNGKQTITRFRDFPPEIPEEVRRRIFGWCSAMCTDSSPFLKEAENSTHTGYQVNHTTYKQTKRELRAIVKKFVEPFVSASGEKVTEKEAAEGKEILELFNQALALVPELNIFGKGPTKPPAPPKGPKDYIYLSRVEVLKKSYKRGEEVTVKAVIKSPLDKETFVRTYFEHYDSTPVVVGNLNDGAVMKPGTIEQPSTGEVTWKFKIEPSLAPGIHAIKVALQTVDGKPLTDKEGSPIQLGHWLYVEVEPPVITKSGGGEGASSGFNNYQWFKRPDLADTYEAWIDPTQMAAFVNRKGRRLEYFATSAKSKRAYWPVVAELVGEKIVEHLLEREMTTKDSWKTDEVRKVVGDLEKARIKLVREMVRLVAKAEGKEKAAAGGPVPVAT